MSRSGPLKGLDVSRSGALGLEVSRSGPLKGLGVSRSCHGLVR